MYGHREKKTVSYLTPRDDHHNCAISPQKNIVSYAAYQFSSEPIAVFDLVADFFGLRAGRGFGFRAAEQC
jgi:hypothetical protein